MSSTPGIFSETISFHGTLLNSERGGGLWPLGLRVALGVVRRGLGIYAM